MSYKISRYLIQARILYIYNNLLRFKFECIATKNNKLIADKTIYSIKMFRSVDISI